MCVVSIFTSKNVASDSLCKENQISNGSKLLKLLRDRELDFSCSGIKSDLFEIDKVKNISLILVLRKYGIIFVECKMVKMQILVLFIV